MGKLSRKQIEKLVDAPVELDEDNRTANKLDGVPVEIAVQHARMATLAMIAGCRDRAVRSVLRAFETAAEERDCVVAVDSPLVAITSVRIANMLESHQIRTVGDLCDCTPTDLCQLDGISVRTVSALESQLQRHGFELAKDDGVA